MNTDQLKWSNWISLDTPLEDYQSNITTKSGFYRIRITGTSKLAYLGQTGLSLRSRTRALARNTFGESPPWSDPHTAAPGLWAWRIEENYSYEVSVAELLVSTAERQCIEDSLLFEYRLKTGESTLCNHGLFHHKWLRPSNKNKGTKMRKLLANESHNRLKSLPPPNFQGQPDSLDWLSLTWTDFHPLNESKKTSPRSSGVYRLMEENEIVYFGESKNLNSRLVAHNRIFKDKEIFVSCSVMPDALPHNLKERETDLIGAYYKQMNQPPKYQYHSNK